MKHTPEEIKYRLSDLGVQIGNIAIEYIADLEKENARLKEINTHTISQLNLDNGELIIENEKLKKENAELKAKWLQATDEGTSWAHLKSLEKENAELKEALKNDKVCKCSHYLNFKDLEKQLTNAKELIENIIRVTWGEGWNYSLDWKVKAEQFLKENSTYERIQKAKYNYID